MKNILRKFLVVLLTITITLTYGVSAFAGSEGDGESGGSGHGGTSTNPYRVSQFHNGFLCYIVTKDRALDAPPVFVKCPSCELWPSGSRIMVVNRIGSYSSFSMYSGDIGAATMGQFNKPAFNVSGYGFGSELKNALISHTGAGGNALVYDFISNLWGTPTADRFRDSGLSGNPEDSNVLCIEAVGWTGLKSSGPMVVYTAWTVIDLLTDPNWIAGGRYAESHLRYRLCVCGYVNHGWLGQHIAVDTGTALSNSAISDSRSVNTHS